MLIIGAKGFAIQLTDVLEQAGLVKNCVYFDDTAAEPFSFLARFPVIRNREEAVKYFSDRDNRFALGIGNPVLRSRFFKLFKELKGVPTSIVSPFARVGSYDVTYGEGSCIMTNAVIESTVCIERGVLINLNATVTHGCHIGDFCEICPGVHISGDCTIGECTSIGTGAVILPKVKVGTNVRIGAGAVITKDIPSDVVVTGVPGRIIKKV